MWLQNVRDRESNSRSNPRSRKGSRTVGKSIAMGKRSFGGSYVSRKRKKAGYKPYKKKLVFHGPVRPLSLGNAGQASDKLFLRCQ